MKPCTKALILMVLALGATSAHGQSFTTAELAGVVTDADQAALPGVTISAVHQPTGTRYSAVTGTDGKFKIVNVRSGGPYVVGAVLEGFNPLEKADVTARLGDSTYLTFQLQLEAVTEVVTVVGESNPLISPSRTGSTSSVGLEAIENLPTIDRTFNDFARTNPFFTISSDNEDPEAISVAGRSSRYNNIQIDGAVNNDLFGLADQGTPGGQAEVSAISLDAIQEIQLLVAPFDVRQGGFTGGGINAITKTGTNRYKGTVFYFTRDDSLVGDGPEELGTFGTFDEEQYGFGFGGPIKQDKIFFFINGETKKKNTPTGWSLDGSSGQCFANCDAVDEANAFKAALQDRYGFDPGPLAELTRNVPSDNFFGRLDFNIADKHQLTLRHNYVHGSNQINRPSSRTYEWDSELYNFRNNTNSTVMQLNSVFGSSKFNELRLNLTNVKERRAGPSPFPWIEIEDALSDGSRLEFEAGTEPFSTRNELDQDIFEITNDFTMLMGNHTITIGTHNELFTFRNLFVQDAFGSYEFRDLDSFLSGGPSRRYRHTFENPGQDADAAFDVNQLGFYVGDQWTAKPNLTLTYGLRVDVPLFPDTPGRNPVTEELYGLRTDVSPDGNQVWSPRLGFNWDIKSDGQQQLRGGLGTFAGRTPYVWISNQYSRTGLVFSSLTCFGVEFNPDPSNPPKDCAVGATGEFNLIDPNFKMPTLWRGNLAYDRQLPWWGLVGTAELLFAQAIDDITFANVNIRKTGETIPFDGRPVFETIDPNTDGAYLLSNTSDGDSTNFALKIERPVRKGIWGFVSYAYGDTSVVNDGSSSRAVSNWRFHPTVDPNNSATSLSNFNVEHRFNASLGYRFNNDSRWPTTVSAFYNQQSGRPYSSLMGGGFPFNSINNDFQTSNDLFYVPSGPDDVVITNGTWEQLDTYISSDSCLDSNRGRIAPRNCSKAPWSSTLDLRLAQDIPIKSTHLQLTFDLLNVMNLLSSDNGVLKFVQFGTVTVADYQGLSDDNTPIYTLRREVTDPENNSRFEIHNTNSRWRARLGARLTF